MDQRALWGEVKMDAIRKHGRHFVSVRVSVSDLAMQPFRFAEYSDRKRGGGLQCQASHGGQRDKKERARRVSGQWLDAVLTVSVRVQRRKGMQYCALARPQRHPKSKDGEGHLLAACQLGCEGSGRFSGRSRPGYFCVLEAGVKELIASIN